jgi:hypothetical protein
MTLVDRGVWRALQPLAPATPAEVAVYAEHFGDPIKVEEAAASLDRLVAAGHAVRYGGRYMPLRERPAAWLGRLMSLVLS